MKMNVYGLTSVVGVFALTTGCVTSEYVPRINEVPVEFVEELGRLLDGVAVQGDVTIRDAIVAVDVSATDIALGDVTIPGVIVTGTVPTTEEAVREVILSMVAQSECPVIGPVVGEFFVDSTINATGTYRLASFDNDNEIIAAGKGTYKAGLNGPDYGNFVGDYNISSNDLGKLVGSYNMQDFDRIGPAGILSASWESNDFSERELEFGYIRGLWIPSNSPNGGYIVGFSADCTLNF
jgi:hypothetical protein